MGVDWSDVRTWALQLSFCSVVMDYANFTGLPLGATVFDGCRLREAVFSACDLAGARFPGCDLTGATIRHANLARTDLRQTRGCAFHLASCTTDGTLVEPETARQLLRDQGILCPDLDALLGLSEEVPDQR